LKYSFYVSNEKNKKAIITAVLGGSIPTGSYSNGSTDASVTPTLAGGVQSYGARHCSGRLTALVPDIQFHFL
jgi:hypothetical protein